MDLFDHADVPDLRDAITVTRHDLISLEVVLCAVDSVVVPVESLNAHIRSNVPNADGLVTGATDESLTEGSELHAVDGVDVASERESRLRKV